MRLGGKVYVVGGWNFSLSYTLLFGVKVVFTLYSPALAPAVRYANPSSGYRDQRLQILLENGVGVKVQGKWCDNALYATWSENHDQLLQMLLEKEN